MPPVHADRHGTPSRDVVEHIARWALLYRSDPWDADPTTAAAVLAATYGTSQQFSAALADLAAHDGPESHAQRLLAAMRCDGEAALQALGNHQDLSALYRTAAQRREGLDVAEIATTHGLRLQAEATGNRYQVQLFVEGEAGRHDILTSSTVTAASIGAALRTAAAREHALDGLDQLDLRLINEQLDRLEQLIAVEQRSATPVRNADTDPADLALALPARGDRHTPVQHIPTSMSLRSVGEQVDLHAQLRWLTHLHRAGLPDDTLARAAAPLHALTRDAAAAAAREDQHLHTASLALWSWRQDEAADTATLRRQRQILTEAATTISQLHPVDVIREADVLARPVRQAHIDAAPTRQIRDLLVEAAAAQHAITKLRDSLAATAADVIGLYHESQSQPGRDPDDAAANAITEAREGVRATFHNAHDDLMCRADRHAVKRGESRDAMDGARQRWLAVVQSAAGRDLSADPGWALLSTTLNRAQAAGWDVAKHLPQLASPGAVDAHPAQELAYRVMDACPQAIPSPPSVAEINGPAPQSTGRAREVATQLQRPQPPRHGPAMGR